MNKLKRETQVRVIAALSEGMSVRSTERLTGVHRDSCLRLMVRVADACRTLMDDEMRNLSCRSFELDEMWGFVSRKQRRLTATDDQTKAGDFWLWSAVCQDTRLVPSFHLGKRTAADARVFLADLAQRVPNTVQLSSDALSIYVDAIERSFGSRASYATIVKSYESEPTGPGRYSPPRVTSVERAVVSGKPDPTRISTSYVERLHLYNRMRVRRLTRLTDAFSRKVENLDAALTINYAIHNYVKPHKSLKGSTPCMAAGVSKTRWTIEDLVALAGW